MILNWLINIFNLKPTCPECGSHEYRETMVGSHVEGRCNRCYYKSLVDLSGRNLT